MFSCLKYQLQDLYNNYLKSKLGASGIIFFLIISFIMAIDINIFNSWVLDSLMLFIMLNVVMFGFLIVILFVKCVVKGDTYKIKSEIDVIFKSSFVEVGIENVTSADISKKINIEKVPEQIVLSYWLYHLKVNLFRMAVIIPSISILYRKIFQYFINTFAIDVSTLLNDQPFISVYFWLVILLVYYQELQRVNSLINKVTFLISLDSEK